MKRAYDQAEPYITKDSSIVRELIHPLRDGNRNLSLAEAIVAVGTETILHVHHTSEEIYHIIQGEGIMLLAGEEFKVKSGDTICIPAGTPHNIKNSGHVPLKILCACAPSYAHDDTELIETQDKTLSDEENALFIKPDPIKLTQRLIEFNTVNPPGNELNCAYYIGEFLKKWGFQIEYLEFDTGRTSLIARIGSGKRKPICFLGHMDTVPLGTERWEYNPFEATIKGDRIYGRGASDMKGGLAAILYMAKKRAEEDGDLLIIITAGEETCCKGATYIAQNSNLIDRVGAMVVAEPTSNYPFLGHKGALHLKVRIKGKTAHASMPEKGENSIYKATNIIEKLRSFDFQTKPHPIMGSPTIAITTISGGQNLNSIPDETVIGIDIRTIPGIDYKEVIKRISTLLEKDMEVILVDHAESIFTSEDNPWVEEVFRVLEPYVGRYPTPLSVPYFTDASVLKSALGDPPTIILGPGEPSQAHKKDEFCYISKIREAATIYTEIARRYTFRSFQ